MPKPFGFEVIIDGEPADGWHRWTIRYKDSVDGHLTEVASSNGMSQSVSEARIEVMQQLERTIESWKKGEQ